MNYFNSALMLVFISITGCTLLSSRTTTNSYSEDLLTQRPRVEAVAIEDDPKDNIPEDVTPTHDQTAEIDSKLKDITNYNKTSITAPGFTIQVYSGTSREQASQAKAQVYKTLPTSRPKTKYQQPIYKVRVGSFGDRLEAQNVYAELLKEFPDAIVIPTKIRVN